MALPRLPHPVTAVVVGLVASLSLAPVGPAAGQSGPPAEAPSAGAFPLPVVAPVLPLDDGPAPLAVTSFGATDGAPPGVEIRFAEPFELPDAFRYRVDLRIGHPGETGSSESRISFLVEEGAEPAGLVEVGGGAGWDPSGEVDVAFDDGVLSMALPDDLAVEEDDLAWLDLGLVVEEGDAAQRFVTPLVPAAQVLTPTGPTLSAASFVWGSVDEQPPSPPLDLGASPTVRLEDEELVVEYLASVPEVADGRSVTKVVDVVRIAPDFTGGGSAPYLVAIDHDLGTVSLLDGTGPIPVEAPNDGSWLVEDLPPRPVGTHDEIRVALPEVLDVFGITTDDLASDGRIALGIARSATVQAGSGPGFPIRSGGVLATTSWLAAAATVDPEAASDEGDEGASDERASGEDEERAPTATTDDDSGRIVVLVAIACLVALLGTAAFLVVRWLEHRRRVMAAGPLMPPGPPPEPTDAEREELAEFTRQLFENRR